MCTEFQTVAHEFGHALLHDSVHAPNFGFCHSAGDALAVILNDPNTQPTGTSRFQTFPWCPIGGTGERFHNRDIGAGWAWGGSQATSVTERTDLSPHCFAFISHRSDSSIQPAERSPHGAGAATGVFDFLSSGSLATSPIPQRPCRCTRQRDERDAEPPASTSPGGTHRSYQCSFERQAGTSPLRDTPVTTPGAPPPFALYIETDAPVLLAVPL